MDSHFEVPQIPLITPTAPAAPAPSRRGKNGRKKSNPASPDPARPKLCPSCSKVMAEYLAPVAAYLRDILSLVSDQSGDHHQSDPSQSPSVQSPKLSSVARLIDLTSSVGQPVINQSNVHLAEAHSEVHSNQHGNEVTYCAPNHHKSGGNESQPASSQSASSREVSSSQPPPPTPTKHPEQHQPSSSAQRVISDNSNHGAGLSEWHGQTGSVTDQPPNNNNNKGNNCTCQESVQCSGVAPGSGPVQCSQSPPAEPSQPRAVTASEARQRVPNGSADVEYSAGGVAGRCPYAYVTIVSSNLSAINAILLANSIRFYNNQLFNVLANDEGQSKQIRHQYHIPIVALLASRIDSQLAHIVRQVFDEVDELRRHDTILLNDERLGIEQNKIHLWKILDSRFKKCLFLESSTLVVGQVSNLFGESDELSASVDCFFPDNFNCSVFVFEPSIETYGSLLQFGLSQGNSGELNSQWSETLDEMTLLNEFFAPKWNKLSFIYNFVRNEMTYTQIPAYLKFGENIRIVNFGSTGQQQTFSLKQMPDYHRVQQPWNIKFNLRQTELEELPFETSPIDNYYKFYLRCFMCRIWPLISKTLVPVLLNHFADKKEWSIFELVQVLGRQSDTANAYFDQNQFTLRRKKSLDQKVSTLVPEESVERKEESPSPAESNTSASWPTQSATEVFSEAQDEKQKLQWENGKVDWMYQHQSDRIINRLKTLIHK